MFVPKGGTKTVTIQLQADELRFWSVDERAFELECGKVELMLGAASNDIRLRGSVKAK